MFYSMKVVYDKKIIIVVELKLVIDSCFGLSILYLCNLI